MKKKYFSGLTTSTFLLALSSLFADISTEMLYPILPVFLTQYLRAPASIVGIIEGFATASQYIIQGISGYFSDKLQKRKSIALFGFSVAAIAKPLMGFANNWPLILTGRMFDRLGAGTRSAPRDALVAASATEEHRGKAFGLEGFGDNLGAFLGPLIAAYLLFSLHIKIQTIFFLTIIPGLLAVCMIAFVKEKKIDITAKNKLEVKNLGKFSREYWKYIFVTAIFGIGNISSAFLILRSQQIGIPLLVTIIIYAFFNLVAALTSYPAGFLSDKLGRKNVLLLSFLLIFIVLLGFGISANYYTIALGFLLYGIYSGIFRSVGKALATDFVPQEFRANGIGWYSTTIGLSGLVASIVGGQLWTRISSEATFIFAAFFVLLGSISLLILIPKK